MSDKRVCRWGILSTAGIARKNWEGIFHAENADLVAVASRSEAKAQAFIDECQSQARFDATPMALGSYEALLAREDIDAVYVPLPTGMRKDWVVQAARSGKHVLCEKPCAGRAEEVKEMIDACNAAGVQFMDGVMYMHNGRMEAMRKVLEDPEAGIGTMRRIQAHFSFCAPEDFLRENIRMNSELEPLGCLGDLGWYTIRMALWAMKYETPTRVSGRLLAELARPDSPRPVPMEFSGELFFENGVSATFYNSFQAEHQQQVTISGSKGYLHLSDFVLPFFGSELGFEVTRSSFEVDGCEFNMAPGRKRHTVAEYTNNHPTAQETKLFQTFSGLVLGGKPDPKWAEMALQTQLVMDACLDSAMDGGRVVEV